MGTAVAGLQAGRWLDENGPRELELLVRAIIYHPSIPVLLTDKEGTYRDGSVGAARLLGLPREQIAGRRLDEFVEPHTRPVVSQLWRASQENGAERGALRLVGKDGPPREVEFVAHADILPARNVLILHEAGAMSTAEEALGASGAGIPAWVLDYAIYLLDSTGHIAAWYSGAARIYGYQADEVLGKHVSFLYPPETGSGAVPPFARIQRELVRAALEGHLGTEGWQIRKGSANIWANAITMALKDENGKLQGFARVIRDFSDRHARDEKLRRSKAFNRAVPLQPAVVGVISGEYDRIPEMNDAFLEMAGYSREDLVAGRVRLPDLTPPEYAALDELAHEESLRFGACTPFQKELLRKDGARVPVLVSTAVLKLSPFRWITFVQDLRERDRAESVGEQTVDLAETFDEIVGTSGALRRVERQIEMVAPTDATVLILGETGTGKELVARALHRLSPRKLRPFVTLNCAAIPTGLLESELFGYERGAFTGALQQKIGRFEMANRGTLFLDEVGDIPLDLQPKLLRALQEKSFERLGGTKTIPIDVRLVAATNRNLTQMMGDKLFRSDLYYRLKVFPITTPALREHPEDIPQLARFFVRKYAAKMGREIDKIPAATMEALTNWSWPGNVRELENFMERSVILSEGSTLRAPLREIRAEAAEVPGTATLEQVERDYIIKVFRECGGVVTTTAVRLGLHRTTLNAMMNKLGISRADL